MPINRGEHLTNMRITCADCGDGWSHSWPSGGPSRRRNAERTMLGYQWRKVWGAWLCVECQNVRNARTKGRARWVYVAGVVIGGIAGALVVLGVVL